MEGGEGMDRDRFPELPTIPIDALFDEAGTGPNRAVDYRQVLHDADVVLGKDWMTGNEFLVFGRDFLKGVIESGLTKTAAVLRIGLDQESEELERLLALMLVVKGRHDYGPPEDGLAGEAENVMPERTVRLYDFRTKQLTKIPARELAPGMVRARITGIDGEVFVDAAQVLRGGEVRHPPFPDAVREQLRRLYETFQDVYPKTLEEWEDGFRRDMHPEREIALWEYMATVFEHFTAGRSLNPEQRRDIYLVILTCMNNGKENVLVTTNPQTLSRKQVNEIVEFFFQNRA
jgi:hypothetical protein